MRSFRHEPRFEAIIFGADNIGAVDAFEPPHSEMTARDILKVLDKGEIDGCTAHRALDHRLDVVHLHAVAGAAGPVDADRQLGLAQLGQRLVNGAAKKVADDFFQKFAQTVAGP